MDYTGMKLLNVIICNRQAREKLVVCFKLTFAVCKKRECFTLRKLSSYYMKLNMI